MSSLAVLKKDPTEDNYIKYLECRTNYDILSSNYRTLKEKVASLAGDDKSDKAQQLRQRLEYATESREMRIKMWREGHISDLVSRINGALPVGRIQEILSEKEETLYMGVYRIPGASREEPLNSEQWEVLKDRVQRQALAEALVNNLPVGVTLTPPTGKLDHYDLDEDGRPKKIWYSSYGSNMRRERMMVYIAGGTPAGGAREYAGARDKSEPDGDIGLKYDHPIHFAGESRVWDGGGIAFLDSSSQGKALGRGYRITASQFDDVVAQENGGEPDGTKLDLRTVLQKGKLKVNESAYGTLVHLGDYEGVPVVTFTSHASTYESSQGSEPYISYGNIKAFQTNKPSDNYRQMIAGGLQESFGLTPEECRIYLDGMQGADLKDFLPTPTLSEGRLRELLQAKITSS